jgi:hypothetical protein
MFAVIETHLPASSHHVESGGRALITSEIGSKKVPPGSAPLQNAVRRRLETV